jgi:hypothetical protein
MSLVAASVDRVPDPPATKEAYSVSQTVAAWEQQSRPAACYEHEFIYWQFATECAHAWPAFELVVEAGAVAGSPQLRQAADASPPRHVR